MSGKTRPPIHITDEELEVIEGALLGDGCLPRAKIGNSCFYYLTAEEAHTEFIRGQLENLLLPCNRTGVIQSSYWDARTGKTYTRYTVRTQYNVSFTRLRELWYPEGKKEVPRSLVLTPKKVLIWYLGDGGIVHGRRSQEIKLATYAFSTTSVAILVGQLAGFEAHIREHKPYGPGIVIPKRRIKKFLKYIGKCPVDGMQRKWKYIPYKSRIFMEGRNKHHTSRAKEFVSRYLQGESCYKIAKDLGIEFAAVRYYLIKAGVYKNEERFNRGPHERVRELLENLPPQTDTFTGASLMVAPSVH